jgi:hypothetical protein
MKDCCEITADFTERQRRVLRVVLWINVAMFLVESTAGLLAHSTALLAGRPGRARSTTSPATSAYCWPESASR